MRNALTSVSLGVQLPQTMRTKIINSDYVDFGQWLHMSENLGLSSGGGGGTHIDMVYVGLYICACFLWCFWRAYDILFRKGQQWQPHRPWAVIDGELWSMYVVFTPLRPIEGAKLVYSSANSGIQLINQSINLVVFISANFTK